MKGYDFEIERIIGKINEMNAKRIGLQFPEGIKSMGTEIAQIIESKTDAKAIILADPTYGACDLKEGQTRILEIDLLIHFGHSEYQKESR